MKKNNIMKSYTAAELEVLSQGHLDELTANLTPAQIEAAIASDPDEAEMVIDWSSVSIPPGKVMLNMRVDRDIVDFFKQSGRGYQTRINAVLRAYMSAQNR